MLSNSMFFALDIHDLSPGYISPSFENPLLDRA